MTETGPEGRLSNEACGRNPEVNSEVNSRSILGPKFSKTGPKLSKSSKTGPKLSKQCQNEVKPSQTAVYTSKYS